MKLLVLGIALALTGSSHGAAIPEEESLDLDTIINTVQEFVGNPDIYMETLGVRAKRQVDHSGFKKFPFTFIGTEVGVKYNDPSDRSKGGEAYIHIDDLKSLIPKAHSKHVKLHVKFDGGSSSRDGLFTGELDYSLEHSDGTGTEGGKMEIIRDKIGNEYHTKVKSETKAKAYTGEPIIPARFSNLDFEISSDRQTNLKAKYINSPMGRDFKVDVQRVPGKSIKATITNNGVVSTIEGILTKPGPNDVTIDIKANIRGQAYTGKIVKTADASKLKIAIDAKKGAESVAQILLEVKKAPGTWKFRGKYSIMGGKVADGKFSGKYENGNVDIKFGPYELIVKLKLGQSIDVEAKTNGEMMWKYVTNRVTKNTPAALDIDAQSEMTLNPKSVLYAFISKNYPFGEFKNRKNTFKLYVDKQNSNALFHKFKLQLNVQKDGVEVLDIKADTVSPTYNFEFKAPNLFRRLGSSKDKVTVTVKHVKGQSLSIESNIGPGMTLDISHQPNSKGGRHINVQATRGGVEMFKYKGETSKVNNAAMLKVGLQGELDLNPESILYKTVVSQYKILTPFNKRASDLEFFFDKQNKNVLFNKWYAKAKIDKDGTNVFNLDISTNKTPYKFYIYAPAILEKLRPGMKEVDVTVEHQKGQLLEMKVKHPGAKFKGFKIAKTGSGNEREIEWNGKKLGSGDYELTDHSFKTTQTLASGKSLTTTVTWKNKWETPEFFTDNDISVVLDGTERKLNLDIRLRMDKIPDMNFNTPEKGSLIIKANGQNSRWGTYSIDRDIKWSSNSQKLTTDVTGKSTFSAGNLAAKSPIITDIHLTYDIPTTDLEGTAKKVLAGKEYSITFPHGSFRMPAIKVGA